MRGWHPWALVLVTAVAFTVVLATAMPLPWWQAGMLASAIATQLLPTLAVLALAQPRPPARTWIGIWGFAFFVSDAIQVVLATQFGNNLWFFAIANPIEDAALLWAFSYWQTRPEMRLSFRLGVPGLAIATFAIAAYFGEVAGFKAVSSPFRLLIITAAIAYTFVNRSLREVERSRDQDWFWTSLGVLLYYAAYVVVDPVSQALIPERMDLARLVYLVKAAVDTLAFILVWNGMRCPVEPTFSMSTSVPSLRSG